MMNEVMLFHKALMDGTVPLKDPVLLLDDKVVPTTKS